MKGVVLAGGVGYRLRPLTKITNKHLLPVYDKPMIYYPLQTLKDAGITNILLIVGAESSGATMNLLGSGKELGLHITYRIQDEPKGIAHALSFAEDFVGGERFAAILADNIIEGDVSGAIRRFSNSKDEACLFLKKTQEAQRFGVAEVKGGKIVSIEEKPKAPKSDLAVIGLYLYDGKSVFDAIRKLKPSERGEYEITDVNSSYVKKGKCAFEQISGEWSDAGTFESLYHASRIARKKTVAD